MYDASDCRFSCLFAAFLLRILPLTADLAAFLLLMSPLVDDSAVFFLLMTALIGHLKSVLLIMLLLEALNSRQHLEVYLMHMIYSLIGMK